MVLALFIAAAAAVQAPQAIPRSTSEASSVTPGQQFGRSFMSPMGEPFFGRTAGEDGLTAWFREADRNHDGVLTVDEMTADAQRFFETLDTDHDGEIGPDEISHYEEAIAPQVLDPAFYAPQAVQAGAQEAGQGQRGKHRHAGDRLRGASGGDDEAGAGRYGLLQSPEPVTSADSDFNRGVSTAEFQNAAVHRFQQLDLNHSGRLTLPELEGIRQAAESAAHRPAHGEFEQEPPIDANGDTLGPGM